MKPGWRSLGALALSGWALMLLGSSCVRANEPDSFSCDYSDGSCPDGERCLDSRCVARDFCETSEDCFRDGKRCEAGRCVPSECFGKPEACGNFACIDGICAKACRQWESGCRLGYFCSAESGGECQPNLAAGSACEAWSQCATGLRCCGPKGSGVCSEYCGKEGDGCGGSHPCESDYCCAQAGGMYCSSKPCGTQ
jgi:hypothetical protein